MSALAEQLSASVIDVGTWPKAAASHSAVCASGKLAGSSVMVGPALSSTVITCCAELVLPLLSEAVNVRVITVVVPTVWMSRGSTSVTVTAPFTQASVAVAIGSGDGGTH